MNWQESAETYLKNLRDKNPTRDDLRGFRRNLQEGQISAVEFGVTEEEMNLFDHRVHKIIALAIIEAVRSNEEPAVELKKVGKFVYQGKITFEDVGITPREYRGRIRMHYLRPAQIALTYLRDFYHMRNDFDDDNIHGQKNFHDDDGWDAADNDDICHDDGWDILDSDCENTQDDFDYYDSCIDPILEYYASHAWDIVQNALTIGKINLHDLRATETELRRIKTRLDLLTGLDWIGMLRNPETADSGYLMSLTRVLNNGLISLEDLDVTPAEFEGFSQNILVYEVIKSLRFLRREMKGNSMISEYTVSQLLPRVLLAIENLATVLGVPLTVALEKIKLSEEEFAQLQSLKE